MTTGFNELKLEVSKSTQDVEKYHSLNTSLSKQIGELIATVSTLKKQLAESVSTSKSSRGAAFEDDMMSAKATTVETTNSNVLPDTPTLPTDSHTSEPQRSVKRIRMDESPPATSAASLRDPLRTLWQPHLKPVYDVMEHVMPDPSFEGDLTPCAVILIHALTLPDGLNKFLAVKARKEKTGNMSWYCMMEICSGVALIRLHTLAGNTHCAYCAGGTGSRCARVQFSVEEKPTYVRCVTLSP